MNIKKHQLAPAKATAGIWLDYDGARFLIASSKSREFKTNSLRKVRSKNQNVLQAAPETFGDIQLEVMADKVLLDWEGVNDGEQDVPYSKENALMLLKTAPDFAEWVSDESAKVANFRAEGVAADAAAVKSGNGVEN